MLSIIIINYNTFQMTCECIESIYKYTKDIDFEIILVDNASKECDANLFKEKFAEIILIQSDDNIGFGRANNLGVTHSNGDYILLINSDVLLIENSIKKCLDFMTQNQNIGILGCKILNSDDTLQKSIYHYIGEATEWLLYNHWLCRFFINKKRKIRALMGSYLMINKSIFVNVGGFDPDFFMYCEELDLCDKIQKKGYELQYFEESQIMHLHGASNSNNTWRNSQILQSRMLLTWKKKGLLGFISNLFLLFFNVISNFFYLWNLNKNQRKEYWQSTQLLFSNFLEILKIPFMYSRKLGDGSKMLKVS